MRIVQIIATLLFMLECSSSSIEQNKPLKLGDDVELTWKLSRDTQHLLMTINIALPDAFRWIIVGFHNATSTHASYDDIAVLTIEHDGRQEVPYLDTMSLDEVFKLTYSQHKLYQWAKYGRRKKGSVYHFTLKRFVNELRICERVTLVWAYGRNFLREEERYLSRERFHFRSIVLDSKRKFCSGSHDSAGDNNIHHERNPKQEVDDVKSRKVSSTSPSDDVLKLSKADRLIKKENIATTSRTKLVVKTLRKEVEASTKNTPAYVIRSTKATTKPWIKKRMQNLTECTTEPCSYSRCPAHTKCIANSLYCTSTCVETNSTFNNVMTSNNIMTANNNNIMNMSEPHCICTSESHWYDMFNDNDNFDYFLVMGIAALLTGLIVLWLVCCCSLKSSKTKLPPNARKCKVSFYKVNDFESSADEEAEPLVENRKLYVD